ncbi:MAG: PAS domain S-box protein [Aquabacterium sp.]|jgi:PAS domain S-box-containing protein|nr:MAG: PAS domain S-box protein [Aquabacterium sp.]
MPAPDPSGASLAALPASSRVAALWRDRLSLLLESTGEGVYGIDMDGRCTFVNRAGAELLGYAADEVIGRNMHELIHHSHADGSSYAECDCPIFKAFRLGLPCRIDTEVLWRADGRPLCVEYSSYPILDGGRMEGAVITFVDVTERRRAQALLRQAHDELEQRVAERTRELSAALQQVRELSAYLESVREAERNRIAREIHDELGSLLVALKMDVAWLDRRLDDRAPLQAKCESMGRLIDTAVDNVGRIITDLRPSILDHQGLWAALEWQAQEVVDAAELGCDWQMQIEPGAPQPQGEQATAVFRIFQEMMSNVARHARASAVRVRIAAAAGQLCVAVHDNGRGAVPGDFERADAWGMLGMRERAGHFGGSVSVDSAPGRGTCVRLVMPLQVAPVPAAQGVNAWT